MNKKYIWLLLPLTSFWLVWGIGHTFLSPSDQVNKLWTDTPLFASLISFFIIISGITLANIRNEKIGNFFWFLIPIVSMWIISYFNFHYINEKIDLWYKFPLYLTYLFWLVSVSYYAKFKFTESFKKYKSGSFLTDIGLALFFIALGSLILGDKWKSKKNDKQNK